MYFGCFFLVTFSPKGKRLIAQGPSPNITRVVKVILRLELQQGASLATPQLPDEVGKPGHAFFIARNRDRGKLFLSQPDGSCRRWLRLGRLGRAICQDSDRCHVLKD